MADFDGRMVCILTQFFKKLKTPWVMISKMSATNVMEHPIHVKISQTKRIWKRKVNKYIQYTVKITDFINLFNISNFNLHSASIWNSC